MVNNSFRWRIFVIIVLTFGLFGFFFYNFFNVDKNRIDAQKICSQWSNEEKAGQLFFLSFRGTSYSALSQEWVKKRKLGGIAFFGSNAPDVPSLKRLISQYKASVEETKDKAPLFIATDHEPGQFMAIRLGKKFSNNYGVLSKLTKLKDKKEYVRKVSYQIAKDLNSWGINTNFYPVLDIHYSYDSPNRKCPVGHRTFSKDKSVVAALGSIAVDTMQKNGILSTIKHYPGHGDTYIDSHHSLPVIDKDFISLWENDLYPFREVIKKDPAFMMAAHIFLPAIDRDNPVTMSDIFLIKTARKKMKFNGILITDDMMMGAMIKNYSLKKASYLAVLNGMDMILITRRFEHADSPESIHRYLVEKMSASEDFRKRVEDSCIRILRTKNRYELD